MHFDAVDAGDHEDRHIGDAKGGEGISGEIGVARGVENVDLVALPLAGGHRDIEGDVAFGFLWFEIGDRGAVFDTPDAGRGAGDVEEGFGETRLSGSAMSD